MAKTVQLLSVIGTVKSETESRVAQLQHIAGQAGLFEGHERTYEPRFDDGVRFPPEPKKVRASVKDVMDMAQALMTRYWDLALTVDTANAAAKADVTVDGNVLLKQVPVGHLLWLARELGVLRKLVTALPELDPAKEWSAGGMPDGHNRADPVKTVKTEKIPGKFVLYEATREHPAQVQRLDKDEVTGEWTTVPFSGAVSRKRKETLLERLTKLEEAVKMAREEANTAHAQDQHEGEVIFGYLLQP
jgi:hypothetical protein